MTTRRTWTKVIAVLTTCFLSLGAMAYRQNEPLAWEELLGPDGMGSVGEPRPQNWLLTLMRSPGEPAVFVAAVCALSLAAVRLKDWRLLVVTSMAAPVAVLLTDIVLKPTYDRIHGEGLAFPSGHSTAAMALALTAWIAVQRSSRWKCRATAHRVCLALAIVPLSTGIAVIALRYHYPADVLGGWIVGAVVPLTLACCVLRTR